MPSLANALFCAVVAGAVWISLGFAVARYIGIERGLAAAVAPALGWAVFHATGLPLLLVIGLTWATAAALCLGAVLAAALLLALAPAARRAPGPPWWAYAAAAALALAPAAAILPKLGAGGTVMLAAPMYDHAKVAMIDAIARLGLPASDPFIAVDGVGGRLTYYYLWHFGAAVIAKLVGASGWEADIGLTGLTAFTSLALMMGLAVTLAGRRGAALWVVPLSLAASLRPLLEAVRGSDTLYPFFADYPPPQGWLNQAGWVPQHLAAADCAVLGVLLATRLASTPSLRLAASLAAVAAAGFASSAWIGGVTFAAAMVPLGATLLASAAPPRRLRFALLAVAAAVLALAAAWPLLRDDYLWAAARAAGFPITLHPYELLGPLFPPGLRRVLDVAAFWPVLLLIDLPAIGFAGGIGLMPLLGPSARASPEGLLALALAILAGTGLLITWLCASTFANNDLGWRAILPAVLALTAAAAAGLARSLAAPGWRTAAALTLIALGVPGGVALVADNATGIAAPSDADFAGTVALWQAVRAASAPGERVANNPLFLGDLVRWPDNLSWALLSDRGSCFAGWDLAHAYAALPAPGVDALDRLFKRVFAGDASAEDAAALGRRLGCRLIVVTPTDGAWQRDVFAASGAYRLVAEKPQGWRIYRALD